MLIVEIEEAMQSTNSEKYCLMRSYEGSNPNWYLVPRSVRDEAERYFQGWDYEEPYGLILIDDPSVFLSTAAAEIERLRAELDRARWIPVTERLPEQWSGKDYRDGLEVPFLYTHEHTGDWLRGFGHKVNDDPDDPMWLDVSWTDGDGEPREVFTARYWFELPPLPVQESKED